jgi:hypothetical protein
MRRAAGCQGSMTQATKTKTKRWRQHRRQRKQPNQAHTFFLLFFCTSKARKVFASNQAHTFLALLVQKKSFIAALIECACGEL